MIDKNSALTDESTALRDKTHYFGVEAVNGVFWRPFVFSHCSSLHILEDFMIRFHGKTSSFFAVKRRKHCYINKKKFTNKCSISNFWKILLPLKIFHENRTSYRENRTLRTLDVNDLEPPSSKKYAISDNM